MHYSLTDYFWWDAKGVAKLNIHFEPASPEIVETTRAHLEARYFIRLAVRDFELPRFATHNFAWFREYLGR